MRTVKIGAMCAHASMDTLTKFFLYNENECIITCHFPKVVQQWLENSFIKICVYVNSLEELLEIYEKVKNTEIPHCLITDNGKTEFHGNKTITCLAIGPYDSKVLDLYTGHLKLL